MKKIFLGILASLALISCNDKTAFRINGTIEGVKVDNATYVYLAEFDGTYKTTTRVDSTIVWDGKFSLMGRQAEPIVGIVEIPNKNISTWVVIEPGNIKVLIDSIDAIGSTVSGTDLNDKYAELSKQEKEINKQLKPLYSKIKAETDIAEKRKLMFEAEELEVKYKESLSSFLNENLTNGLGATLFARNYYMFGEEELKNMLSQIPASYQEAERYVTIKSNMALQANTNKGNKFIDIKGVSPEGEEVALSDYAGKGKVVLVDFWASWCPPCIMDMPFLVDAYAKYKGKGFEIVGVSIDHENDKWKSRIEELNITWPQVSDLKGWKSELSKPYAVSSIPHTVLIDKDGTIIDKKISGAKIDAILDELLK